jgi:hypothetical protein
MKKIENLTKEELIAIKSIINNYPVTSKLMMDIKKNAEYKEVIELVKEKMQKEREFRKQIDEEMEDYISPRSYYLNKQKSLSNEKHNTNRNHQSLRYIKKSNTKSKSIYINSAEYTEYERKYKQFISSRGKSISASRSLSRQINNLEEEYIVKMLIIYMNKYFYPGNMIRYLSLLDKRFCDLNVGKVYTRYNDSDKYSCETVHNNIFLYNFLKIVDVKCLYICFHNGKHYISPLNDKSFFNFMNKQENLPYIENWDTEIETKFNENIKAALERILFKFKHVYEQNKKLEIPCQLYDLVIKHNMFHFDFEIDSKYEVNLIGMNNKHFVSSIINNDAHSISILKLNNKIYFSPSVSSGIIKESYRVYKYVPLFNQYYYFKNDAFSNIYHELINIDVKDFKDSKQLYNSRFMFGLNKSVYAYTADNLHLFSNRHKSRKLKRYAGGGNKIDMVLPANKNGFCWYSSIIASIFYADEISIIMLNKSIRYIKKSLDILQKYNSSINIMKNFTILDYKNYQDDKEVILNIMIYINIFVYTSYACIIKKQFNEINDKTNWIFCLDYVIRNENLLSFWNKFLINLMHITCKASRV